MSEPDPVLTTTIKITVKTEATKPSNKGYLAAEAMLKKIRETSDDYRPPFVIEIGSQWTKAGFAGDLAPRKVISSFVKHHETRKYHHVFDTKLPESDQEAILYNLLKNLICDYFMTFPPSERKMIIVESLFVKNESRRMLAKILFDEKTFNMALLLFESTPLMNGLPWGTGTAMIIDIGYKTTTVFPVFDSFIVFSAYEETCIGAKILMDRVTELIKTYGKIKTYDGSVCSLQAEDIKRFNDLNLAEDFVCRFCVVTQKNRGDIIQAKEHFDEEPPEKIKFAPDLKFPFGMKKLIVPGYMREAAAECLFTRESIGGSLSIAEIVVESIARTPIDLRRVMLNNIIVTGSVACLPGIHDRLKAEIEEVLYERMPYLANDVKFLTIPNETQKIERYSSWLGGSLFGTLNGILQRAYTFEDWERKKPLPDWTNFIDDYAIPSVSAAVISEDIIDAPLKFNELMSYLHSDSTTLNESSMLIDASISVNSSSLLSSALSADLSHLELDDEEATYEKENCLFESSTFYGSECNESV